ncbi:DUF2058 domain-containing protein [Methylomarinum sp. Ch1-1]|uniref:DUF2058 domain-containing protein n=1 Tax=Methylomarinum roseum TaxID=3067653 RepID=A0AAU7NVQ5_9GAMM|nr:DUF2058 domain-containing protein [Methylomarinum sp. Ch1-1]MDP4522821.1 DUF2058 domain-containing protein [Methylomarinum sp. Ch1-1]
MKNQSLQDQLLKAGLVNETKAKQARAEKRKQSKKQRKNKVEASDEAKRLAQENKARQAEKDRLLNEQRNKEAEKQQLVNQVRQLIERNRLPKAAGDDGVAYHFNDDNKVKTIYISAELRDKISAGKLAIVGLDSVYDVVDVEVADKIGARQPEAVIVRFSDDEQPAVDDEYAEYQIPDDLMW